ncbi:MAG: hypothetical protein U9Q66_01100 [Patescibacteria group bacterium]|nr:hypothetical protein [Patescibacteria group bacterium]
MNMISTFAGNPDDLGCDSVVINEDTGLGAWFDGFWNSSEYNKLKPLIFLLEKYLGQGSDFNVQVAYDNDIFHAISEFKRKLVSNLDFYCNAIDSDEKITVSFINGSMNVVISISSFDYDITFEYKPDLLNPPHGVTARDFIKSEQDSFENITGALMRIIPASKQGETKLIFKKPKKSENGKVKRPKQKRRGHSDRYYYDDDDYGPDLFTAWLFYELFIDNDDAFADENMVNFEDDDGHIVDDLDINDFEETEGVVYNPDTEEDVNPVEEETDSTEWTPPVEDDPVEEETDSTEWTPPEDDNTDSDIGSGISDFAADESNDSSVDNSDDSGDVS